jgi:prepilin-type processing-associated H-X9-DG protein
MYIQDYDEYYPYGDDATTAQPTSVDLSGWSTAIYPYVKSAGIFHCPDDATVPVTVTAAAATATNPAGTYDPISYGLNSNLLNTKDAQLVTVDRTVEAFEVSNAWFNPTAVNDLGGPAGNGVPVAPVSITNAAPLANTANLGTLIAGDSQGGTAQYETGYLQGSLVAGSSAPANAYDESYAGGGLHSNAANYLFTDSHVKWTQPSGIYAGFSNTDTSSANICGLNAGSQTIPVATTLYAANTACSLTTFAGTFSVD